MPLNINYDFMPRHKRVNTCKECGKAAAGVCDTTYCSPFKESLRDYDFIRMTADGFDCALPVSMDSHTACSYGCLYCFAGFLQGHDNKKKVGQGSIKKLEAILSGESQSKKSKVIRKALKRDQEGQPCPLQWGALSDPFDEIERQQGWALEICKVLRKYNQPTRISTKGKLFLEDEYLDAVSYPEIFSVAYSLITVDNDVLAKIDKGAPTADERLECMKRLSDRGVKTILRMRPIMPSVTDSTPNHPQAWKELVYRGAEAGADSLSAEVLFVPGGRKKREDERFAKMEQITGVPLREWYENITIAYGKCIRPSRAWTRDFMTELVDYAHKCGLKVGISDPVMAELGDTPCCCGIMPDDPVFGNFEKETAKRCVVEGRQLAEEGKNSYWKLEDVMPKWADDVLKSQMVFMIGRENTWKQRNLTWYDEIKKTWNDFSGNRGVLKYFEGLLKPVRRDEDGNVVYKYDPPNEEEEINSPFWHSYNGGCSSGLSHPYQKD